jgi:replicative DNA helicase
VSARDSIPSGRFPPTDAVLRPVDDGPEDRKVAHLRVPPHSAEAEQSVLGALLVDNSAWDRVGDLLTDADFYVFGNRLVFAAIGALINSGKPADAITVYEHLERLGEADEAGGLARVASLANVVPSASAARRYAEIVREKAVLRRLVTVADEIATRAFNPEHQSVESIVEEAEAKILAVAEGHGTAEDDFKPMDVYVVEALDRINRIAANPDDEADYIPTGIGGWDKLLDGGMRGGELHVLAARPGMGKSAGLLTVATNVARHRRAGRRVGDAGIFTMEMPGLQWANRAIAQVGRVHLSKIKRPERLRDDDWPSVTEGVELLRQMGLHINSRPGLTITQVRSAARKLSRRTKLALLGLDYLGLMRGLDPRMSRAYQIEEITQGLKNLAKELNVPVLLLVQLKRAVDGKGDPLDALPTLADLRDSGAIEQDADSITFVHRPAKAVPDLSDEWKPFAKGFVAKARDSEGGLFHMHYDGPRLQFSDWPDDLEIPRNRVRVAASSRASKEQKEL